MLRNLSARPRDAVALNLAQLDAFASHSRFLPATHAMPSFGPKASRTANSSSLRLARRNTSLVVPHCIRPCAITVALWVIEFLRGSGHSSKRANRFKRAVAETKKLGVDRILDGVEQKQVLSVQDTFLCLINQWKPDTICRSALVQLLSTQLPGYSGTKTPSA